MACSGGRAGGDEFGGQGAMNSGVSDATAARRATALPAAGGGSPPPRPPAHGASRRLPASRRGGRRCSQETWPMAWYSAASLARIGAAASAVRRGAESACRERERGPARQASPAGLGAPAGSARKQQEAPAQARGRCGWCKPSAPRPEPRPAGCASRPCDCRRQRKPLDIAHFSSILRNNAQYRAEASRLCRPAGLRQAIKRRRAAVAHRRHHNTAEFPCEPR